MKIRFNIEYLTTYGEQLVLSIIGPEGVTERHTMSTHDGHEWTFDYNTPTPKKATAFTYYYCVQRGDTVVRQEWLMEPHLIELQPGVLHYTLNDRWAEIPEDAYLYSSAFTDCVARRSSQTSNLKAQSSNLKSTLSVVLMAQSRKCFNKLYIY